MAKTRVVMNNAAFGAQVMSSSEMEAALRPSAESIAAQVPGSTIVAIRTAAVGGGSRVRLRIEAERSFENDTRAALVAAIRSVLGGTSS